MDAPEATKPLVTDIALIFAESEADVVLGVLAKVREGDFTVRMPLGWTGVAGKLADGLNEVIVANQMLEAELARISRVVGRQGELSHRAVLGGSAQSWAGSIESVNSLIDALVRPTSEMHGSSAQLRMAISVRRYRRMCAARCST